MINKEINSPPENRFSLLLYGTPGCHLCDVAAGLCQTVCEHLQNYDIQLEIENIDIADDTELMDKYAHTIPVLKNQANGREISWPFDGDDVLQLLEA